MAAVKDTTKKRDDADTRSAPESSARSAASDYGVIPGLVWAFHIREDGSSEPLPSDQAISAARHGWHWLHLDLTDARVRSWLQRINMPAKAVELLVNEDNHQQLHTDGACTYGEIADLSRDLGMSADEFAHLHFVMNEHLLLTGRYRPLNAVDKVREHIQLGQIRLPTVAALLEHIIDHVADTVERLGDNLGDELDKIEDGLIRGEKIEGRQALANARRTSVKLHRQLAGLRSVLTRLERDDAPDMKPALLLATNKLAQRLDALDHDFIEIRDRSGLLQEEIGAATAEKTQRSLSMLTVFSMLLLPPTFVSGFFGMNTKGLLFEDNPNGTYWAIGLILLSVALVILFMKRIGVLKL